MSKFYPDDVPNDALESVSRQLGDWFDETTVEEFHSTSVRPGAPHELSNVNEGVAIAEGVEPPPAPPPSFEMRETFDIWSLSIDRIEDGLQTDKDLVELARQTGRWHHQVVCNDRPVGFARSTHRSVADPDVCQLYTSDLARHIDDAITWLDEFEKQNPDNAASNRLVRLLFVPSYQTHAFWLIKEPPAASPEGLGSSGVNPEPVQAGSDVLIIDAPSYLKPLRPLMMLTSKELLEALREKEPLGGGLTFGSPARSDD